jgi:hypothetical protein
VAIKRDPVAERSEIQSQASTLTFPIADADAMIKMLKPGTAYHFRSKPVNAETAIRSVEKSFFPVQSQADFDKKVTARLALTKPKAPPPVGPPSAESGSSPVHHAAVPPVALPTLHVDPPPIRPPIDPPISPPGDPHRPLPE